MHTYILIVILSFIIASCIKTSFPKKFVLIGCALISLAVCVLINCVYYGVNYNTMETVKNTKVKIVSDEELEMKIKNDSIIRIETKTSIYNVIINGTEEGAVKLDTVNRIMTIKDEFVDNNQWMMISSYPTKHSITIIGLKKDKYDVFKTYQDSICKRKDTLSKNG